MSILDSIKGTRKLSFGHWRYRLLHWAFNVKNPDPKNPAATGMPKFLYTHFCPLFHLTNLIAILSPLILFIKVLAVLGRAFVAGLEAIPTEKIGKAISWFKPTRQDRPATVVVKRKRSAAAETRGCVSFCCEWTESANTFEYFWACHGKMFETLTREQVEVIFNEYYPKVIEARQRAKIRKDKLRERLIFWTNFSRVFIKWALNVFYFALTLGVLYGVFVVAEPVWDGLCWFGRGVYWLFTDAGSLAAAWFMAKMVFWTLLVTAGFVALFRIGFMQKFAEVVFDGMAKLAPPFYLIGRFFAWVLMASQ
jgi:ABC-type multidrug transport system fused ATPase/permease subunit